MGLLLGIFGAALCGTAFPSPALAARVLFVSDDMGDTGMVEALQADGHQVEVVEGDFAGGNEALRSSLVAYDAVVWAASGSGSGDIHPDAGVFANLESFVISGGRVFVTGYDSVASPADPLLIQFLGATGSTDVPGAPAAVSGEACSLTTGVVDIRGVVPQPVSSDRDTLTGLSGDTREIVGTANGGGSQWTLRTLGAGEIAYVSNGDSGGGSTQSWVDGRAGGGGAYNAALRNFVSQAGFLRTVATEDPRSPRRARVMFLIEGDAPAVMVSASSAWLPSASEAPLTLCAGHECRPIRRVEACSAPRCPGEGLLVIVDESLASVGDFPTGYTEWARECATLRRDPELAGLPIGVHPEAHRATRALRFRPRSGNLFAWELRLEGGVAAIASREAFAPMVSGSVGIGVFLEEDQEFGLMLGTRWGLEARVAGLPGGSGQQQGDLLALFGVAPTAYYEFRTEPLRVSPIFTWLLPEVGVALRSDTGSTNYYLAWNVSGAILLDEHVGLDLRGRVVLIPEETNPDVIATLTLGVLFR